MVDTVGVYEHPFYERIFDLILTKIVLFCGYFVHVGSVFDKKQ